MEEPKKDEPKKTEQSTDGELSFDREMEKVRQMVRACMQCGTCSASCPNAFAMDKPPRYMWRMVIAGDWERLFSTNSYAMCSACYTCTLRCPRGLPLTEAIDALKSIASKFYPQSDRLCRTFKHCFIDNMVKTGRLNESTFMTAYLLSSGSIGLGLSFAPLGLKLLSKGKMGPPFAFGRKDSAASIVTAQIRRKEGW